MSMYDERIAKLKKQQKENQPAKGSLAGSMYDSRIAAIKTGQATGSPQNVKSFGDKYLADKAKQEERQRRFLADRQAYRERHGNNAELMKYDLSAGQKEIDDLNAELSRLRQEANSVEAGINARPYAVQQADIPDSSEYTVGYGITNDRPYAAGMQVQRKIAPTEDRIEELERLISKKQQDFNLAKHYQEKIAYEDTVKNADFDQFDDYVESDDDLHNWINDPKFRESYEARFQSVPNPNARRSKFVRKGYDRMNKSEIAIYNYYYAKGGKEAAQKYLDNIQETLNARVAEGMYETVKDDVALEMVFGAAAGINQFGTNVVNNFRFKSDYIPQSAHQIASGMVREDLGEIGKQRKLLGGNTLAQVAYDAVTTGANMAPSILVSVATGVPLAGTAMMGMSAAGGAYQQALNEGFDKTQARGYSIMVGASEMVMEKLLGGISAVGGNALGKNAVKNIANADTALKAIAKRIGSSMLSEFKEEYLQEVLDPVFRNIMLKTGDDVKLISAEAIYSGILGALTGAFMEAPFAIYGESKTASTGKKLKEAGSVNDLAKIGNTFAPETVAYKLAGKVTSETGAYTIGQLFNEVNAKLTEQNISEIAEVLAKEGVGEISAKQYAKAFAYVVEGGAMPEALVNAIEADTKLANAVRTVLIDTNTTWNQRSQGYRDILIKLAEDKVKGKTAPTSKASAPADNTAEAKTESGAEGNVEAIADGEKTASVKEIASLKNGVMKLRLDDGSEVDSGDASYGSDSEALVYETIAQMTNDVQVANILVNAFQSKKTALDANVFAAGLDEAFRYGKSNIPRKELARSEFASKLNAAQQDFAYRMGQRKAGQQVAKNKATVKNAQKSSKEKTAGKVHFDRKGRTFDKTREASLKTMEQLAALLGNEFYVYESYVNKDGQRVYKDADGNEVSAPNGFYDPETGAIHIDLNAGAEGNGTMIFTVAHELTHFIKHWSDDKFKVLANFLVKQYGENDVSVSELVQKQMDKGKRNGRSLTWDEAYEEMVADSMESMLTDGNVVQMMADLKQQDKTLWQKICDWFKDLANDLKELVEAYKGYNPDSPEGKMVADMQDTIVILESIYADALAEASENLQRAEKNTTGEGDVKMQTRSVNGEQVVWIEDNILNDNKGLPDHHFIANYIAEHIGEVYTIIESGQKVYIGEDLPSEYTQSKYTQAILKRNPSISRAKKRASANLGEMIEIATNRRWERTKHTHSKDAKYGMYRYDTQFGFPVKNPRGDVIGANIYSAELLIRNASDGKKYLYDIVSIKKNTANSEWLTQRVTSAAGKPAGQKGDVSKNSIRNNGNNVNKKFSDRDPAAGRVNEVLQDENAKLKEDVQYLKDLVKLQKTVTGGTKFTKTSVEAMAGNLMKANNVKGNKQELAKLLNGLYEYIAKGEELSWDGVKEMAQPAVDWLRKNTVIKSELSQYAREILQDVRTSRISLDESQTAEAAYRYGSYNDYRKAIMGSVIVSKDGVPLDIQWQEWASTYPDIFDANITASDMPGALSDAISSLRNSDLSRAEYAYHADMIEQDLLQQVYDGYWRVSTLYTVADVKQREINALKGKHRQKMNDLRQFHREKTDQLKQEHRDEVKRIRKEYREDSQKKQQEIIQRYQDSRKRSVENRNKTAMRHKIRKTIRELDKLLNRGSKERNVKEGMRDFVAEALASAEVLFIDDYSNEDIIRNGVGCDTEPWESKLIDETQVLMQRKKDLYIKSAAMHEVDDVIAGNTESFDARQKEADKLDRKIAENMRQLSGVFARERARLNRATVSAMLENLAKAYKSLGQSDDLYIRAATDEVVYQHLLSLSEQMYGATVKDMTLKQLKELDKAYTMVLTTVQNANKVFREGRAQQLSQIVRLVQSQIQSISVSEKDPTAAKEKIAKWIRSFSWNELRPVDAFERLGSDSFTELFWDVIDAQGEYGKLVRECADMVTKARKTANYAKWDMKAATTFKTVDGKEFKLTLGDLMSVYAYSKREQAYDHMTEGGFTFDTGRTYKSKENGKTYVHKKLSSTYKISEENLNRIISSLTAEQRKYVDTMQKFLTEFAKHGNKASRTLYGIDLFTEENYFPLFSEQDFRNSTEQDLNNTQTMVSLKESGMTKQTKPGANNPIVLRVFDDVVLEHLDKMAKYATYVLPIENLQRVFNSVGKDGENNTSTKALISSVFGEEATTYFKNYITDLNGGKQATGAANPLTDLFARSKATAVSANLSVVIQQPTSIIRAMNEIDLKYFVPLSTKENAKNNSRLYDEMMKYAPVAVIKDMGGFDVGSNSGLKGYIGTEETAWDAEKAWKAAQDFFGWGAMQMDRIGWTVIWIAVKRETLKKTGLKYGSQAYLEACGKRFTEVVTKTQVYDSVNSRSGFMRSKNDSLKYLTTYMGEPTVTAGMTYMSHLKLYRAIKSKNKAQISKATGALIRTDAVLVITALVCGFAKSFVYAMRDDDEDESFMERWFKHFGSAIASDRSFLGLLPVFRDIISIANGYTIERPDLALISDLIAASNKVVETISDEEKREKMTPQEWYDLAKNHVGAICNFMGAPAANIIRDVEGAIRLFGDLTDDIYPAEMKESFKRGFSGNEEPKRETLYEAIVADDTGRINVLKKSYVDEEGKFNESAYSSAIRKALREYDPRIREAAQAYFDSDLDHYNEIFDDIFHEDHFEHNDIHAAIMSEVDELEKKNAPEEVEEEVEEEKRPLYSAESYFNALLAGNAKSAKIAYDRLIETELDEGYLSREAENNVKSALASQIGSAYKDDKINRETALKLLKENTDKDETDVKKWEFEIKFGYPWSGRDRAYRKGVISESELTKAIMDIEDESLESAKAYIKFIELAADHSNLEITADDAADYYEFAQPAKISLEAYMEFKEKTSALTVDKDKNGQTINGSKKKKVMDLINAMSLSVHQKDALYYAAGYKESTIDEAPWH